MNPTSIHTLSHSAMLAPHPSPAQAQGAQAAGRPHLTELRQQLLKPDPTTTQALLAQYQDPKKANDPQAQEPLGRELAARQAIDLLTGGAADNDEREFVVLQLLVGDAGGFDKTSVQAVARKLAALSATIARDGASQPSPGSIGLLGRVAEHYAVNMKLALGDAEQAAATSKYFREEIGKLAHTPPSLINKASIQSIIDAFDRGAPPGGASKPGDLAGHEDVRRPQAPRADVDHTQSQPPGRTLAAERQPVQSRPRDEVARPGTRFLELAQGKNAAAIRNEALRLVATSGQPALEDLVDATLDRLCALPAGAKKERQALAALAWNLGGSPAGRRDPNAAMSLCSKFLDRIDQVEDRDARMALLVDFGQAVRAQGRDAVAALQRTVGSCQLPADTRTALVNAATRQQGWLAPWREPKFPQFRGLQDAIRQGLETHDAIEAAPTAASALGILLAPARLATLRHMPGAFQAHASHVLGQVKARAGTTALQSARACGQEAQAREASVPRELAAPFREFTDRLLDMQNALENANSPQRLAQQEARPAAPERPPREPAALPAGPSAAEWDAMFDGNLNDVELVKADHGQPPAVNPPGSNNPFDQPDEVLAQWARENPGPPRPVFEATPADSTFEALARQAAEELRRPAGKDDSGNPSLDN